MNALKFYYLLFILIVMSIVTINAQKYDTIYFDLDTKYVFKNEFYPNYYLIKDSSEDGTFFFEKVNEREYLQPEKVNCLKEYVRSLSFYDNKKKKLNDYRLYEHFGNHKIFLISKKRKKIVEVISMFTIE